MEQQPARSFTGQVRAYFGMKPGQTLSEFGREIKELSDADRKWFTEQFNAIGYPVQES